MTGTFLINSPPITHQTIEGEVVIINLKNGSYYSLRDSGAIIWALVENGADVEQMIGYLTESCAVESEAEVQLLRNRVTAFLNALCDEELIQPAQDSASGQHDNTSLASLVPLPDGLVFSQPEFEKYDDLQDLVMLDPIHQVSRQGWPHPKASE